MSENELIELPITLGILVAKQLQDNNKYFKREKNGIVAFEFTKEELASIINLHFENPVPGALEGIELLPNLETLIISSDGNNAYKSAKNIASISDRDCKHLSKCRNLKSLEIKNQQNLYDIDISKMGKLESLKLFNNKNLEYIFGIEKLDSMRVLECVGNASLTEIENLDKIIAKNKNLEELNLDVLLFPDAIGFNTKTGTSNNEAIEKLLELEKTALISWQETFANKKRIKINNYQMLQMHEKALSAVNEYVPKVNASNIVKVAGVERYLAENVVYDYDALKAKNSHTSSGIISGPINGANGAYNAFMYGTCVCEGYTRAMQYMLKLKGIESRNVYCIGGEDSLHMATDKFETVYKEYDLPDEGYHSIINVMGDNLYLYDDPCWNASRWQNGDKSMPWLLLTKEEISKDHTLSFEERKISDNNMGISKDKKQYAMEDVENFRQQQSNQKTPTAEKIM